MERLAALGTCHRPGSISYLNDHLAVCRSRLFFCHRSRKSCSKFSTHHRDVPPPLNVKLSWTVAAAAAAASPDSSEAAVNAEVPEIPVEESSVLVTTKFVLEKRCEFGEAFVVAGDHELLGAWDPEAAVPMTWSEGHVWSCQLDLPVGKQYEYKFVMTSNRAEPDWQPGPNRSFVTVESSEPLLISESWESASPVVEEVDEAETPAAYVSDTLKTEPIVDEVSQPAVPSESEVDELTSEPVVVAEAEVDEVASEPVVALESKADEVESEPVVEEAATLETESGNGVETQTEVARDPVVAESESTDAGAGHIIEQNDDVVEEPESTPTAAVEDKLSAEEETEAATKSVEAVEASSVPAEENLTPAEADEVNQTSKESTVVIEDSKGFKSFMFETTEQRTELAEK